MPSKTGNTGRPRRARRVLRYLIALAGSVFVANALIGENGLPALMTARDTYRRLEKSLSEAREENARLGEQARRLREDPAAIEEVARRELGLIEPGEKLFILRDVPPSNAQTRH